MARPEDEKKKEITELSTTEQIEYWQNLRIRIEEINYFINRNGTDIKDVEEFFKNEFKEMLRIQEEYRVVDESLKDKLKKLRTDIDELSAFISKDGEEAKLLNEDRMTELQNEYNEIEQGTNKEPYEDLGELIDADKAQQISDLSTRALIQKRHYLNYEINRIQDYLNPDESQVDNEQRKKFFDAQIKSVGEYNESNRILESRHDNLMTTIDELMKQLNAEAEEMEAEDYVAGLERLRALKDEHLEIKKELGIYKDPYADLYTVDEDVIAEEELQNEKGENPIVKDNLSKYQPDMETISEDNEEDIDELTEEVKELDGERDEFPEDMEERPAEKIDSQVEVKKTADTKDFVKNVKENLGNVKEKLTLAQKVQIQVNRSIGQLEKAKTFVNSSEYKNIIASLKKLEDSKDLSDDEIFSKMLDVGQKIDDYLQHKADDGVKPNVFNKLAAVQETNSWLSKMINDYGGRGFISRTESYEELYNQQMEGIDSLPKAEKAEVKYTTPVPGDVNYDEAIKTISENGKGDEINISKDSLMAADECMCRIIIKAKLEKRYNLIKVRDEFTQGNTLEKTAAKAKENRENKKDADLSM